VDRSSDLEKEESLAKCRGLLLLRRLVLGLLLLQHQVVEFGLSIE